MLIIDKDDETVLINHLRILKRYYKNQSEFFKGGQLGDAYQECFHSLEDFLKRIEGENVEKNEN